MNQKPFTFDARSDIFSNVIRFSVRKGLRTPHNPTINTNMNKHILTLLGAVSAAALTAQTSIVDFSGGGMVSEAINLANKDSVMTGTAISPASGYGGPTFYGGATAIGADIGDWRINVSGSGALNGLNHVRMSIANTPFSATDNKFHYGVIFFQQSDFSAFSDLAGGVTLNASTPLGYTAKRVAGNPSRIGYVLQTSEAGNPFFIHYIDYDDNNLSTVDGDGNVIFGQGHRFELADPTAVAWNSFDPTDSLSAIGAAAVPDFTSVTGIGVWFENERGAVQTSGMIFQVGEIQLTAIPEPSAYAAFIGVLALGLVLYRRPRRQ